jgi:hypothetical protein
MNGVVNVISKTPREIAAQYGTTLTIGAGVFDRHVGNDGADGGPLFYVNGSHAQAIDDRWAFMLSAGYLAQILFPVRPPPRYYCASA